MPRLGGKGPLALYSDRATHWKFANLNDTCKAKIDTFQMNYALCNKAYITIIVILFSYHYLEGMEDQLYNVKTLKGHKKSP